MTKHFALQAGLQFAAAFVCTAAQAEVPVTKFEVDNTLIGPRVVYVSPTNIRIDCPKNGLVIISKSPFKQVSCFNESTKAICEQETEAALEELRSVGNLMAEVGEVEMSWSKVGSEKIQGIPCTFYKAKVTHTEKNSTKNDNSDWRKYWTRNDIKVTQSAGDIIAASCGCPDISGVPQRMEHFGSENDFNIPFLARSNVDSSKKVLRVIISTKSRQSVSIAKNFFDVPTGYRKKTKIRKVILRKGGAQSLKDAGKAPGFLFESK